MITVFGKGYYGPGQFEAIDRVLQERLGLRFDPAWVPLQVDSERLQESLSCRSNGPWSEVSFFECVESPLADTPTLDQRLVGATFLMHISTDVATVEAIRQSPLFKEIGRALNIELDAIVE